MQMPEQFDLPADSLPSEFLSVARGVYRDNDHWIPESPEKLLNQFSEANPYFKKCESRVFLVPGVARLVGFFNPDQEINGEKVAYFGYWETVDNLRANRSLFDSLSAWAKKQGATRVFGPINFSTYGNYRLRLDRFDEGSFINEPHNPYYYPEILRELGFSIHMRYESRLNEDVDKLADQVQQPLENLKKQLGHRFYVEHLTGEKWLESLELIYPMVNSMFKDNFAYTPVSYEEFVSGCGEPFAKKMCPRTSVLVKTRPGDIAGFFIAYPDYSPLVNQSAAVPVAPEDISWEKHFTHLPRPRHSIVKTGAVMQEYRSSGVFTLMGLQVISWSRGVYQRMSAAMVREDNHSMSMAANGNIVKSYGLYTRKICDE